MKISNIFLATTLLLAHVFSAAGTNAEEDGKPVPEAFQIVTEHRGTFAGERVDFRAVVENSLLKNSDDEVYAEAVTFSYVADQQDAARPVTFIFNGGPGSASTWLHMGIMGPKRVRVPSDAGDAGLPPYGIEDNPQALLDVTDLVFIDPIGTGFSRLAGVGEAEDVYGLEEDARSVAQIVREWIRANGRWNSPVFIAGESYGTTRAAAMLPYLQDGAEPIRVSGVMMISQAMDYTGSTPVHDNFIAYATYLPSLAATAWYHDRLQNKPETLEPFLEEVRAFTMNEYLPALFSGSSLAPETLGSIAAKLAQYTGIDETYIRRANLRILTGRFVKELLRSDGEIIGRLDGRYRARGLDPIAENARFDVASTAISAAYSSAFRQLMEVDLGVSLQRPYYSSGPEVGDNWVYDRSEGYNEPAYVNTAPKLAEAMARNPALKVMVASGYYDLVTPFFDAEFTLGRHGIDMSRVTMTYYEAGHMMYLYEPAFEQLASDMRVFMNSMLKAK